MLLLAVLDKQVARDQVSLLALDEDREFSLVSRDDGVARSAERLGCFLVVEDVIDSLIL